MRKEKESSGVSSIRQEENPVPDNFLITLKNQQSMHA